MVSEIRPGSDGLVEEKTGVIEPEAGVGKPVPDGLSREAQQIFAAHAHVETRDAHLYRLRGARTVGCEGAYIADPDTFLGGISFEFGGGCGGWTTTKHSIFRRWKLPTCSERSGLCASLQSPSGSTYFHWVFDVLPRLEVYRRAGYEISDIDHFLLPPKAGGRFQQETLDLLGLPLEKCIFGSPRDHFRWEELITTEPVVSRGHPRWLIDWWAGLAEPLFASGGSFPTRIFLSRGAASLRQIPQEEEIVKSLANFGVEPVKLEAMPWVDQVRMIHGAELIVGAHGSGISNVVFCKPGAIVVELFSSGYVNPMYWCAAKRVGLRYRAIIDAGDRLGLSDVGRDIHLGPDEIAPVVREELERFDTLPR